MIFFTSVLIWLLETVKYWFVMHAFDMQLSFFTLMLMNGIVICRPPCPPRPATLAPSIRRASPCWSRWRRA